MRYNLLSAQYIPERIRRDTRMADFNMQPDDLSEWVAEAIRGLEAKGQFATKSVRLEYTNYRCKLPDDWAGFECTCTKFTRSYDYLFFPKSAGVATVTYYVMPVDDEGIPMVIDHPRVIDYVFWFVCEKLSMIPGMLPSTFTQQLCWVRWMDNHKCAQTDLNWPTDTRKIKKLPRHW
jgi:hypothetical protein